MRNEDPVAGARLNIKVRDLALSMRIGNWIHWRKGEAKSCPFENQSLNQNSTLGIFISLKWMTLKSGWSVADTKQRPSSTTYKWWIEYNALRGIEALQYLYPQVQFMTSSLNNLRCKHRKLKDIHTANQPNFQDMVEDEMRHLCLTTLENLIQWVKYSPNFMKKSTESLGRLLFCHLNSINLWSDTSIISGQAFEKTYHNSRNYSCCPIENLMTGRWFRNLSNHFRRKKDMNAPKKYSVIKKILRFIREGSDIDWPNLETEKGRRREREGEWWRWS